MKDSSPPASLPAKSTSPRMEVYSPEEVAVANRDGRMGRILRAIPINETWQKPVLKDGDGSGHHD